ncbi:MAG TPA: hypothetical protein VL463_30640 [Kofleriaceae bacterium]|nr:hypothetical protein [Kofleriaceae bacterium]
MRLVLAIAIALGALSACSVYSQPAGGCDYKGKHHTDDERFPAGDGCNTCQCLEGQAACTLIGCADAGPNACGALTCGDTICNAGEHCVNGACLCGDHAGCIDGDSCASAGPGTSDGCGSICCGKSGPCPL